MKYSPRLWRHIHIPLLVLLLLSLLPLPTYGWQSSTAAAATDSALSGNERKVSSFVSIETVKDVTKALASDEMQGRGTATPGGEKAARHLAARFAKLGLKPIGDGGTFLQAIKFSSAQALAESSLQAGDAHLKHGEEFVFAPPYPSEPKSTTGGLVFVGYGVASSEMNRDDFAGLDLKGKIVVLLNGRPKNVTGEQWGKVARQQIIVSNLVFRGAAGLIFTNIGSKEQPFSLIANFLMRRRVTPVDAPALPLKLPPIMLASAEGAEKLFAGSGISFAQAMAKAEDGELVSRDLNKSATVNMLIKRDQGIGSNVVGMLEGSDAILKNQAVVYIAHYDAFGMESDGRIYRGAADNALGVGYLISIAEAFVKSNARPRRSIIFLSTTGEEYGLQGAEHWVKHPAWPIDKLVAVLNFDGIGTEMYGPVKRIFAIGGEHSDLGGVIERVAAASGLTLTPDPLPEQNIFYRSDHYSFVKAGVPAVMLLAGPAGDMQAITARIKKWLATNYHQTTDTVQPDWFWEGGRALAAVGIITGLRIANADAAPAWRPDSPFSPHKKAAEK